MARIRSPNYPAISLAEAINRVAQVHGRERQHPAAKDVVIKGMGYGGVHGTSLGALSAALKYGLIAQTGKGEDYRVTDRAVAILHPHNPEEKAEAIRAAGRSPALFSELLDYFKGDLPSDDNLRAYLVRRGFSQTSLPSVIQSFRDTMELVSPEGGDYSGRTPASREEEPMTTATTIQAERRLPPQTAAHDEEPYRVSLGPSGLQGSFNLKNVTDADDLIQAINAWKLLLKPVKENDVAAELSGAEKTKHKLI